MVILFFFSRNWYNQILLLNETDFVKFLDWKLISPILGLSDLYWIDFGCIEYDILDNECSGTRICNVIVLPIDNRNSKLKL